MSTRAAEDAHHTTSIERHTAVWNSLSRIEIEPRADPRRVERERRRAPVWLLPVTAASCAAVWGIGSGGERLRLVLLAALAWLLALPFCLGLEAGMIALMLFEPLRGIVRRAQYLIVPYSQFDPVHLITPIITAGALLCVLRRERASVFARTPLAPAVSLLALVFALEIFNPLQGSLFVGLSGALFLLVPVAWFYFGQAADARLLPAVLRLVVIVGLIASLHGIYQLVFGYPSFEAYWLEHTEFYDSIAVGNVQRAIATFSSAEEWGRYVQTGAIAALGLAAGASGKGEAIEPRSRVAWLMCAAALACVLPLTGQRTAILGAAFGAGIFVLLGARGRRDAGGRLALLLSIGVLAVALSSPLGNDAVFDREADEKVGTMLAHATKGALRPTGEDSFQERLRTWSRLAIEVLPYRPLGSGLGTGTLGARRFDAGGEPAAPIDSYFITIAVACGAPAALLLVWITLRACLFALRLSREPRGMNADARGAGDRALWRTIASVLAMFLLNNVFGMTFSLYSVAPVGWLLIGAASSAASRLRNPAEASR